MPLTSPAVLAQNFSAFLLALIYTTQITFTWVREYTGIQHPLWWVAGPIIALMVYVVLQDRLQKTLTLKFAWPDLFFGLFMFCLYYKIDPGEAYMHHIVTGTGIAGFYIMGRLAGHYSPKIFLGTLLGLAYIALLAFVPFLIYMIAETSAMERFTLNIGLVAPQWPGSIIGALIVAAFAYAVMVPQKKWAYLLALLTGLLSWVLIFIGARSLLVAEILVLLLLTFIVRSQPLKFKLGLLVIAVAAALPAFGFLPEVRAEFFKQLPQSVMVMNDSETIQSELIYDNTGMCKTMGNSITLRVILYQEAFNLIAKNPLGIGAGNFSKHSCVYAYRDGLGDPHSVLLHVAVELGLPALVIFLCFIGWLGLSSLKEVGRSTKNPALLIIPIQLIAIWIYHFFNDQVTSSYISAYQFYIISGVLTSCLLQAKKDS